MPAVSADRIKEPGAKRLRRASERRGKVRIGRYDYVKLVYAEKEPDAVQIAAGNLRRDLRRVLDCEMDPPENAAFHRIVAGTLGISEEIARKADISLLRDKDGNLYNEAFLIQERDGELLIAGSDRRGTVYGIYEVCGTWLGVSPWYFFADVPVHGKQEVVFESGLIRTDHPEVEYRGIFINDEEELEHWVQRYMGEDTIGVKTYEKIFELLLRLKLNYIWPAMHVNSFNLKRENGELADRMGIVAGTSHCDMLMRSNNREWRPWLQRKGYTDIEYDFSIPGRNREALKEYWRESVEQNKDFEVCYTLGMRGIHDSGFSASALAGKTGKELLEAKCALLTDVITAQQEILADTLPHETLKTFVPYKEVLELYDNGLEVPQDLTLIWVNDNYGYVRRYPGEKERARKGGNGLYYHNSYWAPPGGSYLFLCSIPLAHTRNELLKAWEEGIRKIWVTNFGAVKPLEQQLTFYAALAWEAGRENALTNTEEIFLEKWIDSTFSGSHGKELAACLAEFDQLTNTRKIEQMDMDAFSQTAYGDEAADRIHRYEEIFDAVNRVWKKLPLEEQDAFFQMIAMKVHAGYFTNLMYYYADRSVLCMKQGKYVAAGEYTNRCKSLDRARRSMLYYYNHVMANGKWNGILTPEDFPPPRTAMHPACMMPVSEAQEKEGGALTATLRNDGEEDGNPLTVTLWNDGEEIIFTESGEKWLEIENHGKEALSCTLQASEWLRFTDSKASSLNISLSPGQEERVLLEVNPQTFSGEFPEGAANPQAFSEDFPENPANQPESLQMPEFDTSEKCPARLRERETPRRQTGYLELSDGRGQILRRIPVSCLLPLCDGAPRTGTEDDGRVCVEAADAKQSTGWKRIENLGRDSSALMEARAAGGILEYPIRVFRGGCFLLEIHRFPSLNSIGEIAVGISVDTGEVITAKTDSNDEYRGTWKENVRNNVDKMYLNLPYMEAGAHTVTFHAVSKYFAFTRFVIYTQERKANSLGKKLGEKPGSQRLPRIFDATSFARSAYGEESCNLPPRPVIYLPLQPAGDSLTMEDRIIAPTCYGSPLEPGQILKSGREIFTEAQGALRIDTASALAQSPYSYTINGEWHWCNSPAHGETGIALYMRKAQQHWKDDGNAPALCYRMQLTGGFYRIWIRMLMWGDDTSHFSIGIDREQIPEDALYGGHRIWRYSNEQVWKWIPVYELPLAEGEHLLQITALSSCLRFEQIYITKGEELPPVHESV